MRFVRELEDLGCEPMQTAVITPQKSAVCEQHGGIWKTHARRLLDEFSIKFVPEQLHRVAWFTAAVTWACNSATDDKWVLSCAVGSRTGTATGHTRCWTRPEDSLHERVTRDMAFSERIAMMSAAQIEQFDSFSRSETLCTALARPCNDHWSAIRVAVVGTPNNDSELQQRSRSTRNSIRTVATWSDA